MYLPTEQEVTALLVQLNEECPHLSLDRRIMITRLFELGVFTSAEEAITYAKYDVST